MSNDGAYDALHDAIGWLAAGIDQAQQKGSEVSFELADAETILTKLRTVSEALGHGPA